MTIKRATVSLLKEALSQSIITKEMLPDLIIKLEENYIMNIILVDNIPIGFIGLMNGYCNELMCVVNHNYRRMGYAFTGCIKTINDGFDELTLPFIEAKTIENSPSQKLATKLGFVSKNVIPNSGINEITWNLSRQNWSTNIIYK